MPAPVGELDGLINLGTAGVSGNDFVTFALGAKLKPSCRCELGVAWEFPISPREDFMDNRLTVEAIFRY